MTLQIITKAPQETRRLGEIIGRSVRGGEIIALSGELGAGKTMLVRGIAGGMGLDPGQVTSPTFIMRQDYRSDELDSLRLVHIDAYRFQGEGELDSIGWDELLDSPRTVIAVEWPERIEAALSLQRLSLTLKLEHVGAESRRITIKGAPACSDIVDAVRAALHSFASNSEYDHTRCPTCGGVVTNHKSADAPFCSTRCRMADLGRWFHGVYRISRPSPTTGQDEAIEP